MQCKEVTHHRRSISVDSDDSTCLIEPRQPTESLPSVASPVSHSLELVESQLSQDNCLLPIHPLISDTKSSSAAALPSVSSSFESEIVSVESTKTSDVANNIVLKGLYEMHNISFTERRLGINIESLSISLQWKEDDKPLVYPDAAVVKRVFPDSPYRGQIESGDIIFEREACNGDYHPSHAMTFTKLIGIIDSKRRPIKITLLRYQKKPQLYAKDDSSLDNNKKKRQDDSDHTMKVNDDKEEELDGASTNQYALKRMKNIERNNGRLRNLGLMTDEEERERNALAKAEFMSQMQSPKGPSISTIDRPSQSQSKPKDGLSIGCEACLHFFRTGKRTKIRHHTNCPRARKNITQKRKKTDTKICQAAATNRSNGDPERVRNQLSRKCRTFQKRNDEEIQRDATNVINTSTHKRTSQPFVTPPVNQFESSSSSVLKSSKTCQWEACGNPWGEYGYVPGDSVMFVSNLNDEHENERRSETEEEMSMETTERFVVNPFCSNSPYLNTHYTGTYHVLRFIRDPFALLPWGFEASLHEFGGACIVTDVMPCSPAEVAKDIGGKITPCTTSSTIARNMNDGVRINDLIVCVNGKSVGGMSIQELEIEIETSRSEMIVVLARCKLEVNDCSNRLNTIVEEEQKSWLAVQNSLNWNTFDGSNQRFMRNVSKSMPTSLNLEIRKSVAGKKRSSETETNELSQSKYERRKLTEISLLSQPSLVSMSSVTKNMDDTKHPLVGKVGASGRSTSVGINNSLAIQLGHDGHFKLSDTQLNEVEDENVEMQDWLEDDTPWNGCVCGVTHPHPLVVFWIACDECNAWYNVSPKCVGFDEKKAKVLEKWVCWDCCSPVGTANLVNSKM